MDGLYLLLDFLFYKVVFYSDQVGGLLLAYGICVGIAGSRAYIRALIQNFLDFNIAQRVSTVTVSGRDISCTDQMSS